MPAVVLDKSPGWWAKQLGLPLDEGGRGRQIFDDDAVVELYEAITAIGRKFADDSGFTGLSFRKAARHNEFLVPEMTTLMKKYGHFWGRNPDRVADNDLYIDQGRDHKKYESKGFCVSWALANYVAGFRNTSALG
jgi:hypothetical protein